MSQRNRILIVAATLVAVLALAAPAPSQAAGLRGGSLPVLDAWERAWEWLARFAVPPRWTARWEKEGGAIDPDGSPKPGTTSAPAPDPGAAEAGSGLDPLGSP